MVANAEIVTRRLRLVLLGRAVVLALLEGDRVQASRLLGFALPDEFSEVADEAFLRIQLQRMEADPAGWAWCVRAMVRARDSIVVGHCGFHGPPRMVGRAEIGYTVLFPYRSQGYATEAALGLIEFARQMEEARVYASVAPTNRASLRVLEKLGFRQVGEQVDEVDGRELVFELVLEAR